MATAEPLISEIALYPKDIFKVSKEIGSALSGIPADPDMKWDEFAMELMGKDWNEGEINQIKHNNRDFGGRCKALLDLWNRKIKKPRWDRVAEVLRKIELNRLAEKLQDAITSLNSRELPLRDNDRAHQATSQDETDYEPAPKKRKLHPAMDEQDLTQRYKDKFPDGAITRRKWDDLKKQQLEILIQTVNKREFYAVMIKLKNASMYPVTTTGYPDESCYYVGRWGDKEIPVAIVQTTMGGDGVHGSYNETRKALSFLPNLKYIFAVGVCGGVKGKVKLGDVVVSKVLQDCSLEVLKAGQVTTRARSWLLESHPFYYFLSLADNTPDIMICGMVLSANKLLKDYDHQKKLLVQFPEAIAFEMEGHGIGRACEESKKREVEFLVVKGVSDLADEDKNDEWQPQAAVNAAHALFEVMAKYHAFDYGKEDCSSNTSVAAKKDAGVVQGTQENVNVEDENKTKEADEMQATKGKGEDDEMQAGHLES